MTSTKTSTRRPAHVLPERAFQVHQNRILAALPPGELQRLTPHLTETPLNFKQSLSKPDQPSKPSTTAEHLKNVLEVNDLAIRFGRTEIFSGLSFVVPEGTALAIIGPNGSGKTVLLRALIGAIPFQGTLRWAPDVHLGYVPQKLDIARDAPITGFDFLRARAALSRTSNATAFQMLTAVGLPSGAGAQPIGALSGGQFQRLLVAFALVGGPNVLLLDEPTAGVDEPGQERLNDLIHRLQQDQGLTVVLISHDLSIVYRYATAVLCLGRERHWFGPPKEILTPDLLHEIYGTPMAFHVHEP